MEIGTRVRKFRTQQGRTLQEVADHCGFSRSLLSKIESGKTSPPISTLTKIAEALGLKLSALLEDGEDKPTVFTPGKDAVAKGVHTDKGYAFFPFASECANKQMQPFLFVAEKGKVKPKTLSHAGEEFVYVLEGEMNYKVGDIEYHLRPGDSLFFDSVQEHDLKPITKRVMYLGIFLSGNESRDE